MKIHVPNTVVTLIKAILPQALIAQLQFWHLAPRVWLDSSSLIKEIDPSQRKALFVDCGSNNGQGARFFARFYKPKYFDYVLIEPNPNCADSLTHCFDQLRLEGEILSKAASTENGTMTLWGISDNDGDTSTGASIVANHNDAYTSKNQDPDAFTDVKTFSFADQITEWSKTYSKIVVKMDVEGSEYDILDDLLEKNISSLIHTLYVEFHSRFREEPEHTRLSNKERELVTLFQSEPTRIRSWA